MNGFSTDKTTVLLDFRPLGLHSACCDFVDSAKQSKNKPVYSCSTREGPNKEELHQPEWVRPFLGVNFYLHNLNCCFVNVLGMSLQTRCRIDVYNFDGLQWLTVKI